MIRIGVVEDSALSRDELVANLKRYSREHAVPFDIRTFSDGDQLTGAYRADFDILFLDVEMARVDGFALARSVREVDANVIIVFVTNMGQYAIKGYEVDALSYLLKPVPYFAVAQELTRSIAKLRTKASRDLVLTIDNSLVRLDTSQIIYAESVKHRITVHTFDEAYSYSGTLRSLEKDLEGTGFFRSNNCYLVNLRYVKRVGGGTSTMANGDELIVSRPRKKAFLEALVDHMGGRSS